MIEFFLVLTLALLFGGAAIFAAVGFMAARYELQNRRDRRERRVPPRPSQVR